MKRPLIPSPAFKRAAQRYLKNHPDHAVRLRATLSLLETDAYDPRLRTHKLTGELAGSYACRAGYDLRVVFKFVDHEGRDAILLLSVGTHDEVY